MKDSISVIILAAGSSARMGKPKPFLSYDEKRNFICKICDTYIATGVKNIILVVSPSIENEVIQLMEKNYPGQQVGIVVNSFPERGRFYSLQLALENTCSSFCFIQNIDNPFVSEKLLAEMIQKKKPEAYVVPVYKNQRGHPVLIGPAVMKHCRVLAGYEFNIRQELMNFEEIRVDWADEDILANINTTDLYQKYFPS